MRDVFIIIFILALIFGGGAYIEKYFEKNEYELIDLLDNIQLQVRLNDFNHFYEIEKLNNIWESSKVKWHILGNHQQIDEIESELERLIQTYQFGDIEETVYCITELKFRINDMHKGDKLEISNIL